MGNWKLRCKAKPSYTMSGHDGKCTDSRQSTTSGQHIPRLLPQLPRCWPSLSLIDLFKFPWYILCLGPGWNNHIHLRVALAPKPKKSQGYGPHFFSNGTQKWELLLHSPPTLRSKSIHSQHQCPRDSIFKYTLLLGRDYRNYYNSFWWITTSPSPGFCTRSRLAWTTSSGLFNSSSSIPGLTFFWIPPTITVVVSWLDGHDSEPCLVNKKGDCAK